MEYSQLFLHLRKVMSQHLSNYHDQTVAMMKTNIICQHIAEAKVTHMRTKVMSRLIEIISKKESNLPVEIACTFLCLRKEEILKEFQEEIRRKSQPEPNLPQMKNTFQASHITQIMI
ncbi:hypothetical protein VP01_4559g1 [Puccinia sorghi]|uniref:Uncharacterized protein n=1 Tax=Puccinia sorghi TaxID=27349 RepID=A0A0L6UNR0_9BASI|nr:hypothetical protein VP01_4559g1 [Puccinia sorghi]